MLLPFFVSLLPCWQNISLWGEYFEGFFSSRKIKKHRPGQDPRIGRLGHCRGGHAVFSKKLLNTQRDVGRWACKSPIMKWANTMKESSKKNSLKPNTASHNNASWSTDTDGFLEHSPSGGSLYYKGTALQKVIPAFGGSPLHKNTFTFSFLPS